MPCNTIGEFVIVDDGNAGPNGYVVEGSEGPEDRDNRISIEVCFISTFKDIVV